MRSQSTGWTSGYFHAQGNCDYVIAMATPRVTKAVFKNKRGGDSQGQAIYMSSDGQWDI